MKANKNLFISSRTDIKTQEWIEKTPCEIVAALNYGRYLIHTMKSNPDQGIIARTSYGGEADLVNPQPEPVK